MTVRLTYLAHGAPTWEMGIEIDGDGAARTWQTAGALVGRCGRELSASERSALEGALATAAKAHAQAAPDPTGQPVRPSGATEGLLADGLPEVVLDSHEDPPPGFGDLIMLLRELREGLADSPVSAIELEVQGSPLSARLRHVGSEPVVVRAGEPLTVQVTVFDQDSAIIERAEHTADAKGVNGAVDGGWELPLVDDLGVTSAPAGGFLTVRVAPLEVDALGDGVLRGVEFTWMTE